MSTTLWYFARSSGIVAYLLLSGSVLLGVLMAGKRRFAWPRFAVEEVHRFLAIVMGAFVALHASALALDAVVPISVEQELVPFTSPYRPFAVGLGSTAMLLLGAVGVSNAVRKRIPHGTWRRLHYLTLPAWLLVSLHGVFAGTDGTDPWFAAIAGGTFAAVAVAAYARFLRRALPA